jgi:hypothetical protein
VEPPDPPQIAQDFWDFMIHVILLADWGLVATDPCHTRMRYIYWFYCVVHLVMTHMADVFEEPPPRPPNQEVIIEEEYARERPDTL